MILRVTTLLAVVKTAALPHQAKKPNALLVNGRMPVALTRANPFG